MTVAPEAMRQRQLSPDAEGAMAQSKKAQDKKTPKPPQDPYGQRSKSLTSTVQRLRGWVGSDPSRLPELADALVQLTEHRLLGHGYAVAMADAQDSVRLAAQLLSSSGPIGPYASIADASRCITALVHVSTVQVGLGRPDTAGQTMRSVQELQQQLGETGLKAELAPTTELWALWCAARTALATDDIVAANAAADSALARLAETELAANVEVAYLAMDIDRLVSDCRWSAGMVEEALIHVHAAMNRYDDLVAGRLDDPGRLSPALVERLAEPLFGLQRDLADRLLATGESDHALAVRRSLVEKLERIVERLGEPVRIQLALALSDLASDLLSANRVDEAEAAAAQAAAIARNWTGVTAPSLLVAAVRGRALTRAGRSAEALTTLRAILPAEVGSPSAAHAVGLLALAEALRAENDADAAESAERTADDIARQLVGPGTEDQRLRSAVPDLARGVVTQGSQDATVVDPAVDLRAEAELQRETATWLESERAEAHRQEVERMERARADAERREAERVAAEQAAAEQRAVEREQAEAAERLRAEQQAAAEEEERLARKRRREERLEEHRLEAERLEAERIATERIEEERIQTERIETRRQLAEQGFTELPSAEQDGLAAAQQAWQDAKATGDRRAARAANERVIELLRPRAREDLAAYGPQLRRALEELSSARLRSGDIWGSRTLAREAKALARSLGR